MRAHQFSHRTADGADEPERGPQREQMPARRRDRREGPRTSLRPRNPDHVPGERPGASRDEMSHWPDRPDGFNRNGIRVSIDPPQVSEPDPVAYRLDVADPSGRGLGFRLMAGIDLLDRHQSQVRDPLPAGGIEPELVDADYLDGARVDPEITDWDIPLDVPPVDRGRWG